MLTRSNEILICFIDKVNKVAASLFTHGPLPHPESTIACLARAKPSTPAGGPAFGHRCQEINTTTFKLQEGIVVGCLRRCHVRYGEGD